MANKTLGGAWLQKESAANTDFQPVFPYTQILETESGHTLEFDDTPTRERIRIGHRMGTFIEMNPDGSVTCRTANNDTEVVIGNKEIKVKGDYSLTIEGDTYINSEKSLYHNIKGSYNLTAEGEINIISKKSATILSNEDMKIGANSSIGGALRLIAGDHVYIGADLAVSGEITALKIMSKGRIDAAIGISAGPMGFTSATGGLTVGMPVPAIPGYVMASIRVTAGVAVSSPYATFMMMNAIHAADQINTNIYGSHIHMSPKGPTSTPIIPMIPTVPV